MFILPVAGTNGFNREWNRWHFTVPMDYELVDLSFVTEQDEDQIGHLFAVRIDGQLVYSGRPLDNPADALMEREEHPLRVPGIHMLRSHG